MSYPTDEHGCLLCPFCPSSDDRMHSECGWRGLFLVWESALSVTADTFRVTSAEIAAKEAETDCWRVECPSGHVLAVSRGEETAGPFYLEHLPGFPKRETEGSR